MVTMVTDDLASAEEKSSTKIYIGTELDGYQDI